MFFCGNSDVGKRRATNQDSFDITELGGGAYLCTVCDGMGGANGGNVASEIASRTYTSYVKERFGTDGVSLPGLLCEAVSAANTAVYEKSQTDEELKGMGTTLVSALISDNKVYVVNVGDSRLYTLSNGEITQITRDHSYVQYLVDMGQITVKEAETASIRNIIIRSVGNEPTANPDTFEFETEKDGYIHLCSDGLVNCVKNSVIASTVKAASPSELQAVADKLIELANSAGGVDNITVVLGKFCN